MKQNLQKIEEYAKDLMTPRQIAVLLDIDVDRFEALISDKHSEECKAYYKGFVDTELKIHQQNIELALTGSPSAIDNAHSYIENIHNAID